MSLRREMSRQREIDKPAPRGLAIASLLCGGLLLTFGVGAASEPIKLAVFDFELEDFSGGSLSAGGSQSASSDTSSADTQHLANVSNQVRQVLAKSERYQLVDVAGADAPAAKGRALRDCDGCEADIARKLGADQSLIGVVSRISRTEYVVKFHVRDARTGAVVTTADSGLKMGADYSWSRGAASLVKARLLE